MNYEMELLRFVAFTRHDAHELKQRLSAEGGKVADNETISDALSGIRYYAEIAVEEMLANGYKAEDGCEN